MRKVVVYQLMSLDGVAEGPDRFFGWDDDLDANLAEVISTQDAVILGRTSFEEWAPYWPTSDMQPFADFINGVAKHIATSGALQHEWSNARPIRGGLSDAVRELKRGEGGDIGVHASISVARALLEDNLVDELRLVIAPALAGTGRRSFDGLPTTRLEPVRLQSSASGHLMADYRLTG